MMSMLDGFIKVSFCALALVLEVNLFLWITCASEMNQAQWAWLISLVVLAQMIRGYLLLKFDIRHQVYRVKLQVVVACIFMLLGAYLVLAPIFRAMLDQCPEAQTPTMRAMAFLNIAFCLVWGASLVEQAQAAPPNPMTADPDKLLADLTLRTFTQDTQSRDTVRVRECVICLSGPYCPGEVATELHCHHTFHSSCIAGWILHGGRGCPMRCIPGQIAKNEGDVEAAVVMISAHEVDVGEAG